MSRLRHESGVTLVELMVAMMIGTMTILAVYGVLDTSIKQSTKIAGRVNATQRGRIAMARGRSSSTRSSTTRPRGR